MNARRQLRALLASGDTLCFAGVLDGISARVADRLGFDGLFMTGNGAVASALGLPDLGLATATEMAAIASSIARCCRTPLLADADTGYGDVSNVRRTVRDYEHAGVAGLQMEDQRSPKRCGQSFSREVVDLAEMVAKVRAAVETRSDDDLVIVARTDALHEHGLEEALARASAYAEAGADLLLIEGLLAADHRRAVDALPKPLVALAVDGRAEPAPTLADARAWGVGILLFPSTGMLAAASAYERAYGRLKETGSTRGLEDSLMPFAHFMELMDVPEWRSFQVRLAQPAPTDAQGAKNAG